MRILIADDDDYKREQLATEVGLILPDCIICFARSFRSAVNAILDDPSLDLVLLDMTMPTFDPAGPVDMGRYEPFAGMEVLAEIDGCGRSIPVIVVTQFERFGAGEGALTLAELDDRLAAEYPAIYRGYVFFDSASVRWRTGLASAMGIALHGADR